MAIAKSKWLNSILDNLFGIITPIELKMPLLDYFCCRQESMPKVRYLRAGNSKIIKFA
jgi:hypothetical protein